MAEPTRRVALPEPKPRFPSVKRVGQRFAPQDDVFHFILSLPWWQYLLLVLGAFLSVNVLFAGVYALLPGAIAHAAPGSIEDGFYFSVQTLATIGYGGMYPLTRVAHLVVTFESLVGMLFVAVITGLTYARFARPTARVLFSAKMCVTPRNGVPHLCIRMANWRNNSIVEASLTAMVLINEVTQEGEQMRKPVYLPLVREKSSVFILSWTAMHPITEASPLYGDDVVERAGEARLGRQPVVDGEHRDLAFDGDLRGQNIVAVEIAEHPAAAMGEYQPGQLGIGRRAGRAIEADGDLPRRAGDRAVADGDPVRPLALRAGAGRQVLLARLLRRQRDPGRPVGRCHEIEKIL